MCLDLRGRRSFRVQPNAAPLKLRLHSCQFYSQPPFRVQPNAAPLKLSPMALAPISELHSAFNRTRLPCSVDGKRHRPGLESIPRSTERGSIEALTKNSPKHGRWIIPRSTERGSIEAKIADAPSILLSIIPRSTERGSIEATHFRDSKESEKKHSAFNRTRLH